MDLTRSWDVLLEYLTLGDSNFCKQSLRHLGSLHLMLNLFVDGGVDIENTAVCPQPSVTCDWRQSCLQRDTEEGRISLKRILHKLMHSLYLDKLNIMQCGARIM